MNTKAIYLKTEGVQKHIIAKNGLRKIISFVDCKNIIERYTYYSKRPDEINEALQELDTYNKTCIGDYYYEIIIE